MNSFSVLTSSESNEYYTPKDIIESARKVMGSIDIDPASNPIAQNWIKSKVYYTQSENGYNKKWHGNLWLNPPYGRSSSSNYGASKWMIKAHYEFLSDSVTQGLVLARGDSKGLKLLTEHYPFIDCDRISFLGADSVPLNKPVPGSRIFYLSTSKSAIANFVREFSQYGTPLTYLKVEN